MQLDDHQNLLELSPDHIFTIVCIHNVRNLGGVKWS